MTEIEFGPGAGAVDTSWLADATGIVRDLGFSIVTGVRHDDPAATDLVVAVRTIPTLRHFDPEEIAYFEARGARSASRTLDRHAHVPFEGPFEWGRISIADRLGLTNQWLSFGGTVRAAAVDDSTLIVRFSSPGPIQRWSGHSQGLDPLTPGMGAFFGRLMVPVDFEPGAEGRLVAADPLALYCAFIADAAAREGSSYAFARADRPFVAYVEREAHRLQAHSPTAWHAGTKLLADLGLAR